MKYAVAFVVVLALVPARRVHADSATDAEQAVVMMEQVATIIDTNKDNCDAMGDKLTAFIDKNLDQLQKLRAAGKNLSEQQKKEFSEKYKDRMKAVSAKMMPGLQKCASNTKVTGAMKKLSASTK